MSTGGSCIIAPLGEVLAGPAREGEEILFADIDLDEIARGKFDLDVVGRYARPDIFSPTVDTRVKHPVGRLTRPEPAHIEAPVAPARQPPDDLVVER